MDELFTVSIRMANAIVWTFVVALFFFRPANNTARQAILVIVLLGMWSFNVGGFAVAGLIPGGTATMAYNLFAGISIAVGIGLLLGRHVAHRRDRPPLG